RESGEGGDVSEPSDEHRGLRLLVDELAAEQPPELPWDAIEHRLMAEIARRERAVRAQEMRSRPGIGQAFVFAAAAACLVIGGMAAGSGAHYTPKQAGSRELPAASYALAQGEPGARGERDLLTLKAGDVIEAIDTPATFSHPGTVAWTLAPASRLVV